MYTSIVMSFNTKFRINQGYCTHRTRDLALDGEPDIKLPHVWKMHDFDDCPVIQFPSVRLQHENSWTITLHKKFKIVIHE